jgi:uncharacterized hydantoinase/oxoprolinase family protein
MSARDQAIDELAKALGLERVIAAGLVDLLVLAAVVEAGHRVGEALVEPLAMLVTKHADGVRGVLQRAHRELTEVSDG